MRQILCFALFLLCSCKTTHGQKTVTNNAPLSSTPMSCIIEGQVISIQKPFDTDTASVCARYPCRAIVLIKSVSACGSSVSFSLKSGDTVEIKFAYTLLNTSKIFPSMKTKYPGLKKGGLFLANTTQRIKINNGNEFIIYDYRPE